MQHQHARSAVVHLQERLVWCTEARICTRRHTQQLCCSGPCHPYPAQRPTQHTEHEGTADGFQHKYGEQQHRQWHHKHKRTHQPRRQKPQTGKSDRGPPRTCRIVVRRRRVRAFRKNCRRRTKDRNASTTNPPRKQNQSKNLRLMLPTSQTSNACANMQNKMRT